MVHSAYTLSVSNPMSTQTIAVRYRPAQMYADAVGFKDPPYLISASVRVRAETRRLFQALMVPEYLEAWLRVPGEGTPCTVTPLQQAAGFALNWHSANATQSRILAIYRTCRRRKLMICWKLERDDLARESTVVMHLNGDFGCSVLSLLHLGFKSFDDFAWHRQLWGTSLERLAKLF